MINTLNLLAQRLVHFYFIIFYSKNFSIFYLAKNIPNLNDEKFSL